MIKENFTDNISVETMAKLIDEAMVLEKNNRRNISIFKVIPAVAAILLVIGLVNFLPVINLNGGGFNPSSSMFARYYEEIARDELTVIPRFIEKSVFESLLERIPEDEGRKLEKMRAYYSLRDISAPELSEEARIELLLMFPFIERGAVYIFDPNASDREITEILGYWNNYIGWSDAEYLEMLEGYFNLSDDSLTVLPRIIEKSVFDNLLADIADDDEVYWNDRIVSGERAKQILLAYYLLIDPDIDFIDFSEILQNRWQDGISGAYIELSYSYTYIGAFYAFDPYANDRELGEVLKLWNDAMDWTDADYLKMLDSYDMIIPRANGNINDNY